MIVGYAYLLVVLASFVLLWGRHAYLIHIRLNKYMMRHHRESWEKMKEDTSLYRLPWMNFYYTKAVYDFIWNSEEDYGDASCFAKKEYPKVFVGVTSLFCGPCSYHSCANLVGNSQIEKRW